MIIRVYVDGDATPVAELPGSSGRLELDTTAIPDGVHRLRIETVEADRVTGQREIPFSVRNGPGIAVAGLSERDEVRGKLGLAVDATVAGIDGALDVRSLELHRGLPFWTGIATDQPAKIDPMQVSLAEGSYLPILDFDAGKADPARGAATYRAKCAGCHGDDGQGRIAQSATLGEQGIFPRLAGQPAAYLYRQLWSFAHGWRSSAAMPPMADGLTEADWADIAVHLEHLTATAYPPPPVIGNDVVELGRSVATLGRPDRGVSPCTRCHGPSGIGVAPYFPALMGQDARYITAEIIAFRGGQRRNAILRLMDPVAHGLEAHEIEAVAGYFARQRPGAVQ